MSDSRGLGEREDLFGPACACRRQAQELDALLFFDAGIAISVADGRMAREDAAAPMNPAHAAYSAQNEGAAA